MTDIALHHVATYKAGEAGYYRDRPHGHLMVTHDNKRYLYNIRGLGLKARDARAFIKQAWDTGAGTERRICGTFPDYYVE